MQDQTGGGPNSGPPANTASDRAAEHRQKTAEAAAARRRAISPHLYNNQSYAENSQDAMEHHKIRQQRAQEQQKQQAASPSKPREDTARAQAGAKEVSDAPHRQRNQGNQPGRYRELQNAAQVQQASNGNKGQGRSGP